LEQIKHVIAQMPAGSDIERRNRALIAFTILTVGIVLFERGSLDADSCRPKLTGSDRKQVVVGQVEPERLASRMSSALSPPACLSTAVR
jgi:hypothetical protein